MTIPAIGGAAGYVIPDFEKGLGEFAEDVLSISPTNYDLAPALTDLFRKRFGYFMVHEPVLRSPASSPTSWPGWFIANPLFSSIALEHLIVAGGTTACGCGTVRVEERGGARSGGLNGYAAPMDWNFLFLGRGRCRSGDAKNNYSGQRKFCPD
jgi:hypothetical protein